MFTKLKHSRYPVYAHVLEYGRTHPGAIFLEMACSIGNDARQAALDGYPIENIIATDLNQGSWDLGFKLFKDDPTTFPVPFIQGDIFSPRLLDLDSPHAHSFDHGKHSSLASVESLTELRGHVSIIHASAFFHLFSKDDQEKLARRCVALLRPEPGCTIFGSHTGASEPGIHDDDSQLFCHSPETWRALWTDLFELQNTTVHVVAELEPKPKPKPKPKPGALATSKKQPMVWSVTVL